MVMVVLVVVVAVAVVVVVAAMVEAGREVEGGGKVTRWFTGERMAGGGSK